MKRPFLTPRAILCALCLTLAACGDNDPASNPGPGDGDGGDGGDGDSNSEIVEAPRDHVSVRTLLLDIVNRDELARWPEPEFTCKQFSSYDRASTVKDGPGWYGNDDNNKFIRAESNNGRTEFVLMEADGPGAIVRFWMTFAGANSGRGTLRIYIDDETYPSIEGTAFNVLSGTTVTSGWLANSVSPLTPLEQRGHNLYHPIPYAKKCKVTYECLQTNGSGEGATPANETVYYNINYRTYKPGTRVVSYSRAESYKALASNVQKRLNERPRDKGSAQLSLNCTLAPSASQSFTIMGAKAIRHIGMQLAADNINQALRSTVLEIEFDGQRTVWVPVGDFFGIGYHVLKTNMWNVSATTAGQMDAYWVMPFQGSCKITLHNLGTQTVTVRNASAGSSSWSWDSRSMYFGADWHAYNKINTRTSPITGATGSQYDINYTTLQGKGVYVGDGVALFNGGGGWWGEGDEKVYVDGETFPSHFGTGTEDYYGYAWCLPAVFTDHPFIAQPEGKGSWGPNYTTNTRHRALDGIPFTRSLTFDMEIWHWDQCIMSHAPTTFWYMVPGGKTLIEPDIDGAKAKVVLSSKDFTEYPADCAMALEAEDMSNVRVESGELERQTAFGDLWSAGMQLFWHDCNAGSKLTANFESTIGGTYKLTAQFAIAPDYGTVNVKINGKTVASNLNLYNEEVATRKVDLGEVTLNEGSNTFEVEMVALSPGYPRGFFGIDLLLFYEP